jgi:hypothetical protein
MVRWIATGHPGRHLSHVTLGLMVLLCVGVVMQLLGAPLTLWNVAESFDSADPLTTLLLEALSLPSLTTTRGLELSRIASSDFRSSLHGVLDETGLFHPPSL